MYHQNLPPSLVLLHLVNIITLPHVFLSSATHREVPTADEIKAVGNYMPRMADNAEALIDYALSHIPESTHTFSFTALFFDDTERSCDVSFAIKQEEATAAADRKREWN